MSLFSALFVLFLSIISVEEFYLKDKKPTRDLIVSGVILAFFCSGISWMFLSVL